jgi:hypothetical protein
MVGGPDGVVVASVVVEVVSVVVDVDSVVGVVSLVSVDVVSVVVDVSVDVLSVVVVSLDGVPGSDAVVVSVDVESERTASGPAPATTPAVTSPPANIVTSTNPTRTRCRRREAAVPPEPISHPP